MTVKANLFRKFAVRLLTLTAVLTLGAGSAHAGLLDFGKKLLEGTTAPAGAPSTMNTEEIGSGL